MGFQKALLWISAIYIAVQAVIWAKCAFFFSQFGHGRVALFNQAAFSAQAIAFDHWFHFSAHILIAIIALLFGWFLQKIEWKRLVLAILAAVALHNIAYWLTSSFPSPQAIILDFAEDSIILLIAVLFAHFARKIIQRKKS